MNLPISVSEPLKTRRQPVPRHLTDLAPDERRRAVAELGEPAYRAQQLAQHYFVRHTTDPDAMTDLPAASRSRLADALLPALLTPVRELICDGGDTVKTVWRGHDGVLIESVLMRYPGRVTVCVSSQAGCGMGCPFCATGQGGLTRNLSTGEIVEQVVAAQRRLTRDESGGRVSNVVFMGMGEPLANYHPVIAAIRRLTDPHPHGAGLSQRSITLSTVGLVPRIDDLAEEGLAVTLALSLHAPDDELRNSLVPVNQRWPVSEAVGAALRYARKTGRRMTVEYALINDINDDPARADALAELLRGTLAHVNLIPLNPTPGSIWTASTPAREREFVRRLRAAGVATTVRDTRGREVAGACGQLAAAG
jgi:23S rRNA (adenine2503-C2)-methyltransferase